MHHNAPLILTLRLDAASFTFFNTLRQQYFPRERNFLSAHLTLFHHLPPHEDSIDKELERVCAETSILPLRVAAVVSIGKGVAYKIECAALVQLHKRLQAAWLPHLTPQDRQGFWPHVTVQNKVSPNTARQTFAQLQQSFVPFAAEGTGLQLWRYEGGPWTLVKEFCFHQ